jgi:hypothetical protein
VARPFEEPARWHSVAKPGLYANIHAKRKRGDKMRKPGQKGAPTDKAFKDSAKTAKKGKKKYA